jgi:hypothetical protein
VVGRARAREMLNKNLNSKKSRFLEKNRKSRNSNKVYFTQNEDLYYDHLSKLSISVENSMTKRASIPE